MRSQERIAVGRMPAVLLYTGLLLTPTYARSERSDLPPAGLINVAYRQREQGKLSSGIHVLHLFCFEHVLGKHRCILTTVTINQCMDVGDGPGFYPKAERSDTLEDELKVVAWDSDFIALEEKHDQATFNYRFGFTSREGQRGPEINQLTSFSGGATKLSFITNSVLSWDLVPLEGIFTRVPVSCPAMVPGVPTPEEKKGLRLLP